MLKKIILIYLFSLNALAYDDTIASSRISAEGIRLQSERLKIIAQNIANANTTGMSLNEPPYTRKIIQVKRSYNYVLGAELSSVDKIARDNSDYVLKYEPHHPAADENGNVKYPNVDHVLEMADAKEAQRSYEANLSALDIARSNQMKILEAMK